MTSNLEKIRKCFLILLGATVPFGTHAANLISNGGFESPVTGPGGLNSGYTAYGVGSTIGGAWTVVGSPFNNVAVTPSTEFSTSVGPAIYFLSQEGSQSLDLTGEWDNGAVTGVEQSFATLAGHQYSLSFYVGAVTTTDWAPHQGLAVVDVQLNGGAFQTAINSDPSGDATTWKAFNYIFIATGPSTTLTFLNGSSSGVGENGLDNVSVLEVPEPGTAGVFLFGAGLFLRWKRKH